MRVPVSHVIVASNVYVVVPSAQRPVDDAEFRRHVRGRPGIRRIAQLHIGAGLTRDSQNVTSVWVGDEAIGRFCQGWLTPNQLAELADGIPCARCHRIPIGPDATGQIVFRCPDQRCAGGRA